MILKMEELASAWFAASRRGFRQQFLDDGFHMLRLQADRADNAFAVNNGVGRIIVHCPRFLGFQFGIAGGWVFDAMLPGVGGKDFLSVLAGADTDDDQSFILVFFEEFGVVGNGPHAGAAPGGV